MSSVREFSSRTFVALSVRNFRLYFVGQLISISGTWMQAMAQSWLVLQLTNSSVDLGIAVALQFLPMLLFGSYGGLLVDRGNKRRILYITQSSAGALALLLGILVATHHVTLASVYVVATLLGCVNLFDMPARQSFVQEMVGRELIANAVSLNSVLMNAGRVIGPSIAAGFIAVVGMAACFFANAASFVAVLVALALMDASSLHPLRTVRREKGQLRLGLRYVAGHLLLRNVISAVALVGTFAFNFTVTLPLLIRGTFHDHSATPYGILMGAMGAGAVVGGLIIAHRSRPTIRLLTGLTVGFGVALTAVALAPSSLWADILIVPTGALSIAFISTANSSLQLHSREDMRGRVMSLYGIAFQGSTPVGAPLMGLIVAWSNPRAGLLVGAVVTLLAGGWLWIQVRKEVLAERTGDQ